MIKRIFTCIMFLLTLTFMPGLVSNASARIELSEVSEPTPKVVLAKDNILVVTGAAGKTLNVYDLVCNKLMTVVIDSSEKRIDLSQLGKGIYIAKVGSTSKRVLLK